MSKIIKDDINQKIAARLMRGDSIYEISKALRITQKKVFSVLFEGVSQDDDKLKLPLFVIGRLAFRNITELAHDASTNSQTRLKANKILVDYARESAKNIPQDIDSASLSQDQLIKRLNILQQEALKRAQPVNNSVIDNDIVMIDNMLD